MSKNYLISENKLRELLKAEADLCALEAGGVDNWNYYSESFWDFYGCMAKGEDEELDELSERYIDKQLKDFMVLPGKEGK